MRLDNDLIRDTLICIQQKTQTVVNSSCCRIDWNLIYKDKHLNSKYGVDEIKYCILKLSEAKFININKIKTQQGIFFVHIFNITEIGILVIKSVINDDIWNEIKQKLNIYSYSFQVLVQLVDEYASMYHLK